MFITIAQVLRTIVWHYSIHMSSRRSRSRSRSRSRKSPEPWTICLDYDGTIFEGHTNGTNQKNNPMNLENEIWFKSMLKKWQGDGHYVAIITRGVRDNMADYITRINIDCIKVEPTTEITDNKKLYIYGADDYDDMRDATTWSKRKVNIVGKFIKAVGGIDERMVFADDTMINIEAMRVVYSHDNIVNAGKNGDYKAMFREVDDIVDLTTNKDAFYGQMDAEIKTRTDEQRWSTIKKASVACVGAACAYYLSQKTQEVGGVKSKRNRKHKSKQTKKHRRNKKNDSSA